MEGLEQSCEAPEADIGLKIAPTDPHSLLAAAKALQSSLRKEIAAARLSHGGDDSIDSDALVTLPANMTEEQIAESGLSEEQVARANMSEAQIAKYRMKQELIKKGARLRLEIYRLKAAFHDGIGATSTAPAAAAVLAEEGEDDWKALVGLDD